MSLFFQIAEKVFFGVGFRGSKYFLTFGLWKPRVLIGKYIFTCVSIVMLVFEGVLMIDSLVLSWVLSEVYGAEGGI